MTAKKKHAGGRPTKYTPELLDKAHEYLESWRTLGESVPTVVGMCLHCSIGKHTAYDWIKDEGKAEFSHICKEIEAVQEKELVNRGLSKDFQPQVAMMLLGKHGYSTKAEIDHTTKGEKIEPTRIIFEDVKGDA